MQDDTSDRVQQLVDGLKKQQHGDKYTTMQYRLWGEMINGGLFTKVRQILLQLQCLNAVAVSQHQLRKDHS